MRIVRAWSAIARVGREFEATLVVELLDRAHQAEVALLDQVQERQPAVEVLLGHGNHEPQVGLGQVMARLLGAGLHLLGQFDLLLGGQQIDAPDLLEVHPDGVVEGHRTDNLDLGEGFLLVIFGLGLSVGRDLDTHLLEDGRDANEAIGIALDRGKGLHDVVWGQVALILPLQDQRFRAQHQRIDLDPRLNFCHPDFLPIW